DHRRRQLAAPHAGLDAAARARGAATRGLVSCISRPGRSACVFALRARLARLAARRQRVARLELPWDFQGASLRTAGTQRVRSVAIDIGSVSILAKARVTGQSALQDASGKSLKSLGVGLQP